jgi:hypothetical protein
MSEAESLALLNQMTHEVQSTQNPLRHFFGRLVAIPAAQNQRPGNAPGETRNVLELTYMFSELDVKLSSTPYPFPTGELKFYLNNPSESPQPTSRPGIWLSSIGNLLGAQAKIPDAIGKVLEVMWTDEHPMKRRTSEGVFEDYLGSAYEVVGIDGKRAEGAAAVAVANTPAVTVQDTPEPEVVDTDTMLVRLADGQNHTSFMGGIIGSETLKANEAAYTAMLADNGSTVINRLIAEGKLVNDEGIYHAA